MRPLWTLTLLCVLTACSTAYYGTMEKFGVYKRDILVDRVVSARDAQDDAKAEFQSALEQFGSVVSYNGGELEATYKRLDDAYKDSESAAKRVDERIRAIERVAEDLFDEWEDELDEYSNASLRADSERQLRDTQREYQRLIRAMKAVQAKIPPVLTVFHDQVLYLKHNLNARAVAALRGEYRNVQGNVSRLLNELDASIREADQFIQRMKYTQGQ
ncbi:DUF2959 domain-containing protein [Cardiobacteriaceae bacterium TAE3-ERU3]|nr:DUF2959 domain-containing protein [Cardiobacteriaceae bacterium TAE3-ERU3]